MLEFSLSLLKTRLQVCTRADVAAAGHDRSDLRAMLRSGELVRLGRGWFGTSATPATVASALRRGHRLTCGSAVGLHGVFVPTLPAPHEVGRQCRCPESRLVVEHPPLRAWPDDEPIMPLRVAIRQALGCLEAWEVAVVLESALHRGLVTDDDVEEALAGVTTVGDWRSVASTGAPCRARKPGCGAVSSVAGSGCSPSTPSRVLASSTCWWGTA